MFRLVYCEGFILLAFFLVYDYSVSVFLDNLVSVSDGGK